MIKKLKNIFNLSKLYILENDASINIINMETKRINKKSALFWSYLILFFGILYISSETINFMLKTGKPEIFINGFFLLLEVLIIIRTIMVSMNVFYFSKDIENILHLPIKPLEILVSKFNTILFMNYELELIFSMIPLLIYGIYTYAGVKYYFNLILLLLIYPIFATLIVSIIMIFLMKTIKIFKNKEAMQIVISFILIIGIMFVAHKAIEYVFNNSEFIEENQQLFLDNINEKIIKINNYFLNINPSVNILLKKGLLNILLEYFKLIIITLFSFILFVFLGKKLYLQQLLKANFYYKKKKSKKIKLNKYKNKGFSYIKKESKIILKNPLFFIQSIYPVIMMTVMICVLVSVLVPVYNEILHKEEYKEILENLKFNIEDVCIILGAIQITGLFNYSSITSFSREGKNAYIMKLLPISLYKQFMYKNIPQIFFNIVSSIIILTVINFQIPMIGIKYILVIFILSALITIINSFILCLIDLRMPRLEWDAEYEILKNNKNKLLQYALIVFNILFLMFINRLFERHDLNKSLIFFTLFLIIILFIFNILISKYKNKLFNKIN